MSSLNLNSQIQETKEKPNLISIIIPAYNEEKRITEPLTSYCQHFEKHYPGRYEIIVVLNGCKDNTLLVVQEIAKFFPSVKYLNFQKAIGKGGAIIEGFKIAKGKFVGYTDADGSTSPNMMDRLLMILQIVPTLDCIVGSRNIPGSIVHGKSVKRKILSAGFNIFVNLLFFLNISDTQCGAKILKKSLLQNILPYLSLSNFAFDINFLVDVKKANGKIIEFPIEWKDDHDTTIKNPFKTSVIMAISVVRLWFLYSPLKSFYNLLIKPIDNYIWQKFLKQEIDAYHK